MTLDDMMRVLSEIEDQAEFDRLWKNLGEIVREVAKKREALWRAAFPPMASTTLIPNTPNGAATEKGAPRE